MESQRRLYFKKQIIKELSQQKTAVSTSAENENSKYNEVHEDCVVTLLGSQSYYDQIQRFPFVNTIPSNPDNSCMEKESQDHDSTTKALLEDITNKDLTKEKSYTVNIEDIRIDIKFEWTENTEEVWNKENSRNTFIQKENHDSITIISRPKVVQPKYKTTFPITMAKYKDLKELCNTRVIPKNVQVEYTNFPHRVGKDVLIDTDIEDEIEA